MRETICWISGSEWSDFLPKCEDCTNDKLYKMTRIEGVDGQLEVDGQAQLEDDG
jgi:hypothetical protein